MVLLVLQLLRLVLQLLAAGRPRQGGQSGGSASGHSAHSVADGRPDL